MKFVKKNSFCSNIKKNLSLFIYYTELEVLHHVTLCYKLEINTSEILRETKVKFWNWEKKYLKVVSESLKIEFESKKFNK